MGGFVARIACTFFSSGEIPPARKTTPKNTILSRLNSHFCLLSVRPLSPSRLNSASNAASCFSFVYPYIFYQDVVSYVCDAFEIAHYGADFLQENF